MKKRSTHKPLRLTVEKVRELQGLDKDQLDNIVGGRKVKPTCADFSVDTCI
jgi:hypothetical protein